MLHKNNKNSMLLVTLELALGTNNVLLSLSNKGNTLGIVVFLGFALVVGERSDFPCGYTISIAHILFCHLKGV